MDNICNTCVYAIWEESEEGYFPEDCKKCFPVGSIEDKWGDIVECPEWKEEKRIYDEWRDT